MRQIICGDAVEWLKQNENNTDSSVVASLPDISEFNFSLDEWKSWFVDTAKKVLKASSDEGVAIFYQSDIKYEGEWVDKSYLCQKAAESLGYKLLWHKIICRAPAGTVTMGRPSYSHILCFSKSLSLNLNRSTPDVLPLLGEKSWARGMGSEAAKMIASFIAKQTASKFVINPFCGEGLLFDYLEAEGLSGLGIERSPKRAEKARSKKS